MIRPALLMLTGCAGLAGCQGGSNGAATASAAPPSAAPASAAPASAPTNAAPASAAAPASIDPAQAPADARPASAFAAAWVAVMQEADEEVRLQRADALGPAWQGRRYTWTGLALAGLCSEQAHTCALQVFTADLPNRALLGGSLPLVTFRADQWGELHTRCGGQDQCVVRFEGALVEARTDPEQALRLVFADARVLEARAPAAGEAWFRPPAAAPASVDSGSLRTGAPATAPIHLPRRVF